MLDTAIGAFTDVLCGCGIDALREYPATRLGRRETPVVCVGARSGKLSGSGYGEYLGLSQSDGGEIYALRLELVLGLNIFCPPDYEGGCVAVFEKISSVLPQLPSGLKPSALVCGEVEVDSNTGLLRCACELHCTASLICQANEETGEFYDFELKGVLKHGNN